MSIENIIEYCEFRLCDSKKSLEIRTKNNLSDNSFMSGFDHGQKDVLEDILEFIKEQAA